MTRWQEWRLKRQTRKAVYVIETGPDSILIFSTDYYLDMEDHEFVLKNLQEKFGVGCMILAGKPDERLRLEGVVNARQSR